VGVTDDGTIAVFQGIPGEIAGFNLSTVDLLSNTKIDELTPVAQEKVKEGIPAANQGEARQQLDSLLDPNSKNVLPYCPVQVTATATATPGATFSSEPQPTGPPDCRPAIR
jgi:protein phosphatase